MPSIKMGNTHGQHGGRGVGGERPASPESMGASPPDSPSGRSPLTFNPQIPMNPLHPDLPKAVRMTIDISYGFRVIRALPLHLSPESSNIFQSLKKFVSVNIETATAPEYMVICGILISRHITSRLFTTCSAFPLISTTQKHSHVPNPRVEARTPR